MDPYTAVLLSIAFWPPRPPKPAFAAAVAESRSAARALIGGSCASNWWKKSSDERGCADGDGGSDVRCRVILARAAPLRMMPVGDLVLECGGRRWKSGEGC